MPIPLHTHQQASAYDSPWTREEQIRLLVWEYAWDALCRWTPKPFNPWRLFVLRLFGAKLYGSPFVHQRAKIQVPWKLTMCDRAALGDEACAYSLGEIEIGPRATVAQEAYLCTGTHDFADPAIPLQTAPIIVGEDAFVGARAFVMPGVSIGARAVVGAMSVVTRDVPPDAVAVGIPCRVVGRRKGVSQA